MDLDPQGTSRKWLARRRQNGRAAPAAIFVDKLTQVEEAIAEAAAQGCEYVLIDLPPEHTDQRALRAAIQVADYCICPSKISIDDYEELPIVADIIKEYNKPMGFYLSMTRHIASKENARAFLEAAAEKYGADMYSGEIGDRAAFIDAAALGMSVYEYDNKSLAATEMKNMWNFFISKMDQRGIKA